MSFTAILMLGFFLGMRHATDSDHVVAVSTIVTREKSLRAAFPIGLLWGIGHTLTIVLVGGAIISFGLVIPPRLGLGMELVVALMLVVLGALNVKGILSKAAMSSVEATPAGAHARLGRGFRALRPVMVGVVHGLAGSAAVALLVLGAIRNVWASLAYLFVFGAGTVAGMLAITMALAMPVAAAAHRFASLHRLLAAGTGLASVALGAVLVYDIGFVQGLFAGGAPWAPH